MEWAVTLATTKDLEGKTYRITVSLRLHLFSTSITAHDLADDIERNITSSDVEFLEGHEEEDSGKKNKATTGMVIKDKPESITDNAIDNALTTSDLSGLQNDASEDVEMNDADIMSVFDQINDKVDKGLTLLSHTAPRPLKITHRSSPPCQSSERTLAMPLRQGTLKITILLVSSHGTDNLPSVKKARLGLSLPDSDSSFGNNTGRDENR